MLEHFGLALIIWASMCLKDFLGIGSVNDLVNYKDVHRTTLAIQCPSKRVSQFLNLRNMVFDQKSPFRTVRQTHKQNKDGRHNLKTQPGKKLAE